ncbi:MAG: DegT/DnrJ/EryC1/StrS family aminotransferase [Muribaculaceae bacterium]|nr:DegT/DnrJ/EryC1/StrS family aminotransferase [Muribaculaceae bacterium]
MIPFLDLKKINDSFQPELNEKIADCVASGWYLLGKQVKEFEKEYSEYIGTSNCVACANGLDALTLIFRGYIELGRLKPGDEVIVPGNTYIATILSITECGLVPILVDADPITLQIDSGKIEEAITPLTRAVAIVHLYGRNSFATEIADICSRHNLILVEDNAQAAGCRNSDGRITGSLGNAAAHSFYPGKNLGALGDGGAVTTNDPELARIVRTLAFYGSEKKYVFDYCGRNSRLDEIQAAVLRLKLPRLDEDNSRRRVIAEIMQREISNPLIGLPYPENDKTGNNNVFHLFPVFCEDRDRLQNYLMENGIQTIIHYPIPPHRQKCYEGKIPIRHPLDVTEWIARTELSLPISQVMTEEEALQVCSILNDFK